MEKTVVCFRACLVKKNVLHERSSFVFILFERERKRIKTIRVLGHDMECVTREFVQGSSTDSFVEL